MVKDQPGRQKVMHPLSQYIYMCVCVYTYLEIPGKKSLPAVDVPSLEDPNFPPTVASLGATTRGPSVGSLVWTRAGQLRGAAKTAMGTLASWEPQNSLDSLDKLGFMDVSWFPILAYHIAIGWPITSVRPY